MDENRKREKRKKYRSDSDGVTVKKSWYSFSEYYPGGGSSQKYRKVMKETKDEKRTVKIILAVFGLFVAAFTGFFSMSVAIDISNAPTTVPTEVTESATDFSSGNVSQEETTEAVLQSDVYEHEVTVEEPEREVNVTQPLIE